MSRRREKKVLKEQEAEQNGDDTEAVLVYLMIREMAVSHLSPFAGLTIHCIWQLHWKGLSAIRKVGLSGGRKRLLGGPRFLKWTRPYLVLGTIIHTPFHKLSPLTGLEVCGLLRD